MIINIRVTPRSSRNRIEKEESCLRVYVTKAPESGLANKAAIELLAEYFNLTKSRIQIIKGETSRDKVIKIT